MDLFSANVLLDLLLLCFTCVGIGLPLYYLIRKSHSDLDWHHQGNINTSSFNSLDLIGIFASSLVFTFAIISLQFPNAVDTSKVKELTGLQLFIGGLISQTLPVIIACAFLIPRMNVLKAFNLDKPQTKRVLITALIGLITIYLVVIPTANLMQPFLVNNLGERELQAPVQMMLEAKENNPSMLVFLSILAVIVAPLCEEFVFRGYIYGTLKKFSCSFFATTISALFFAIVHTSLWSLIPLFIVGFFLAIIYEKSGSLWAPIITHALFNGITTSILIFGPSP